jgi:hypothetical protein
LRLPFLVLLLVLFSLSSLVLLMCREVQHFQKNVKN